MPKYVLILGAVFSGCGKGVAAASLALLMKQRGHVVQLLKLDPYLNSSASVLAPREHGESFVTDDGKECDLDLGHYYRISGINVTGNNIHTSGGFYKELFYEEEHGKYLGQTVQIIPHLTNKIQQKITEMGKDCDILFCEVGGTSGDIEGAPYLEAIRQFKLKNPDDVLVIVVGPILWNNTVKEFKTKPLQNSIKTLQSYGIQPDILLCRVDRPIPEQILEKLAGFTNVNRECIFDAPDVPSIYHVAIEMYDRHIDDLIVDKFHLKRTGCRIHKYRELVEAHLNEDLPKIKIGVFGKYDNATEAYLSLKEAIYHAGINNNVQVEIAWRQAGDLEDKKDISSYFQDLQGMIIPGGFDSRSVEGKIKAINYARENKIPFLGICLGLQCAVIEFARNVCGMKDANSIEFDKECKFPVIHFIEGQEALTKKSGTMRLGAYDCKLKKDSLVLELYGQKIISERHRHRYEVNETYVEKYEKKGFFVSGKHPESNLIEMMELDRDIHPFFIGTQTHPEFKSRLMKPAPLFDGLVKAATKSR